jgi:hypothetical protein
MDSTICFPTDSDFLRENLSYFLSRKREIFLVGFFTLGKPQNIFDFVAYIRRRIGQEIEQRHLLHNTDATIVYIISNLCPLSYQNKL